MKLKTFTTKELRDKKLVDIEKYIVELKTSQSELNHLLYTNKETKTHQVGQIKKAIARAHLVHTEVKQTTTATEGKEK